jgi:RHS repeat-associated protein
MTGSENPRAPMAGSRSGTATAVAPDGGGGGTGPSMVTAPTISLPKGGGAIRGIGEKFTANPVTGTGALSVPIATSPGRSGFGPQLNLSYDSGAGNGSFGIGWNLSLPAITRKTDKGLPKYRDAEESDVFILSGAEDLVPVFKRNPDGTWIADKQGNPVHDEEQRDGYTVKRYRPRIEGLFARIERWERISDGDTHWRSISKDNILTVYGSTSESRVADPADPSRIFSWLICQSYDDKGNAIAYSYVAENGDNVDVSQVNERNRTRSANRYLKCIRYGNRQPLLIDPTLASFRRAHVPTPDFSAAGWMFELVLDYGEGHYQEMAPDAHGRTFAEAFLKPPANGAWPVRPDPFSAYRSCFEVRTYRLCRRVLLFHHFPNELGVDDYLVRSTEFSYLSKPNGSFISQIVQSGFKRIASSNPPYLKRSLPPLELEYSVSPLDDLTFDQLPLEEVDTVSLENLPSGIEMNRCRWIDLDGEGISGVLTEDANAWFYKRNLGGGRFGPVERISPRPAVAALNSGRQQLLDLAGDGNLDLVDFASATKGYFSRTDDAGWDRFRTFSSLPGIDWQDFNLRFVDLTGDGHADILLTEDQAFSTWFESYAEEGFGPGLRVTHPLEEEDGPRLVFADGTQSIYLADMSGDGLSDLVRIRNGDVSYWPNIGYGRFGAKVTLNNVPWFDDAESFDQRRVHLTDTDGSGPTDLIYLGRDGIRIYLNQHGNSLSDARLLDRVPGTNDHTMVSVVDFLGRGTACLLWSSPLPADDRRPLRYLDLMGGIKPHLLTLVRNNLGSETRLGYTSSTEFYLADKAAGTPWMTRLPFPVHVVTRVETNDLISGNRFVTSYSYHHGYFDGIEREFRGFGRVEQRDTEEFGVLAPATNLDTAFNVPPALTKTWFHTGAYYAAGERISRHFEGEYYCETEGLSQSQVEAMLLDDTDLPTDLADAERREAVRSLKGAILRQEIYALDDKPESSRPYSVSERNYTIKPVQPQKTSRHSVFFTHARETIDFHYERKLFAVAGGTIVDVAKNPGATLQADPRVSHTVTLAVDDYGNVLQSIAIAYGRRFDDSDPVLTVLDKTKQKQLFVSLTEASFSNAVVAADAYRAPLPAEATTYELLKLNPAARLPSITNLFRFDELVAAAAKLGDGTHDLPYEAVSASGATGGGPYRRSVERLRTRYRSDKLANLLPLNALDALALPGESYKLAFTPGLLSSVYQRSHAGQATESLLPNPGAVLKADAVNWADRGGYVDLDGDGNWWIPSGRVFFHPDPSVAPASELAEAVSHFFLQRRFRDAFSHDTVVEYSNDLLPAKTQDPLGNTVEAVHDYRVLQPKQLTDPNGNRSCVVFDAFGLPVASALQGKITEVIGDSLDDFGDFDADPTLAQLQAFVAAPQTQASALVKSASSRFVYDLDRFRRCAEPPFAAGLIRETHVSDPLPPQGLKIQTNFIYSDGFGRVLQSKTPAESGDAALRNVNIPVRGGDIKPGPLKIDGNGAPILGSVSPRWVGRGRTVYNNKGKPVKQYEPFFSSTHLYEPEPEMTDTGVTPILCYDPLDRVIATLHPNHTYEKVVFDPWRQETWDVNDTVTELDPKADIDVGDFFKRLPVVDYLPTWYDQRRNGQKGPEEKSAADKAAAHAGTPTLAHADSLGRTMLTIADNGVNNNVLLQYATRLTLDIEGNQRDVIDAKSRVVMRYDYDMLGTRIHQASMEAGERWMLNDATGKPICAWNSRKYVLRTEYDALRRPLRLLVQGGDPIEPNAQVFAQPLLFERTVYGESSDTGLTELQQKQANLRTKVFRNFDGAGIATTDHYDFKGNLMQSVRQFVRDYESVPDWSQSPSLESETFSSLTFYDALNRPITITTPDKSTYRPSFNEANLLEKVDVNPRGASVLTSFVTKIDYTAKGQRTLIRYGNGATTTYEYDDRTFRLSHLKTTRAVGQNGLSAQIFVDAATVQKLSYTYDPAGNITGIADGALKSVFRAGQQVNPACDFTYDPLYRLIEATGREHVGQSTFQLSPPDGNYRDYPFVGAALKNDLQALRNYVEQYSYDPVGNFEEMLHQAAGGNWTRAYAYSEISLIEPTKTSNRLSHTALPTNSPALPEPYSYDAHGNVTHMPHLPTMQWDFKDQLIATSRQIVNSGSPEMTFYVYDAGGQRARKVTQRQNGTRKNERLYLGWFELYREYVSDGSIGLERETLHVMDDKWRITLIETQTIENSALIASPTPAQRFQLANHLGSASLELDGAGALISYEEYNPYGNTTYQVGRSAAEVSLKRYRYTGKERDEESGLDYYGARYSAPWLARWASTDPAGLADGPNLYVFVRLNPVIHADITGHMTPEEGRQICEGIARRGGITLRAQKEPVYGQKSTLMEATDPTRQPYKDIVATKDMVKLAQIAANISLGFLGGEAVAPAFALLPRAIQLSLGGLGAFATGWTTGEAIGGESLKLSLSGPLFQVRDLHGWDRFEQGTYGSVGMLSLGMGSYLEKSTNIFGKEAARAAESASQNVVIRPSRVTPLDKQGAGVWADMLSQEWGETVKMNLSGGVRPRTPSTAGVSIDVETGEIRYATSGERRILPYPDQPVPSTSLVQGPGGPVPVNQCSEHALQDRVRWAGARIENQVMSVRRLPRKGYDPTKEFELMDPCANCRATSAGAYFTGKQ